MGLRIRKTIKIAPGVHLNFGKKGISTSIGKRGAGITIGSTGTTAHVGIPGTGISYVKKAGTTNTSAKEKLQSTGKDEKTKGNASCLGCFLAFIGIVIVITFHSTFKWGAISLSIWVICMLYIAFTFKTYLSNILKKNSTANTNRTDSIKPLSTPSTQSDNRLTNATKDNIDLDPIFEEAAYAIVLSQQGSTALIQRRFAIGYNRAGRLMDQLEVAGIVAEANGSKPRKVLVQDIGVLRRILLAQLVKRPSCVTNQTIPANRHLSDQKDKTEGLITEVELQKKVVDDKPKGKEPASVNPLNTLMSLIGLTSVKEELTSLINFIKLNKKRAEQGLPVTQIAYHCVFTGNPGTGKTTVARLLAEIFKELGILKKGQLIETDRSGLVAEYVGQTAVKTNKIIDSALDGVLFIDEAYTLAQGGGQDYGHEAIATLLKRMEDNRDRLIVILAGYGSEMKTFIDSNPGLRSRFNRYVNFPDYTPDELLEIFRRYLNKQQYVLSESALTQIADFLAEEVAKGQNDFGNARFVRNLFEKSITQQANRLALVENCNKDMLKRIEKEDIIKSIERM